MTLVATGNKSNFVKFDLWFPGAGLKLLKLEEDQMFNEKLVLEKERASPGHINGELPNMFFLILGVFFGTSGSRETGCTNFVN